MQVIYLLCLCLAAIVAIALHRFVRKKSQLPFPPGPLPELLIGNLRQIPRSNAWRTYADWSKKYKSDVISFTALGKRMVVLNSARAVTDLLEKRGNIYSERDPNVMVQDLIGFNNLVFMPYNDTFRLHRKIINTALNPSASREYHLMQQKEAYEVMYRFLDTPEQWSAHLRRAANSIILTMAYGHEVTTNDDSLVVLSERFVSLVRRAVPPTAFVVNMVPSLKHIPDWIPWIPFKTYAREGRKLRHSLQDIPFEKVKSQMASGVAHASYTTRLLEINGTITGDPEVDEEDLIKTTAAIMFGAGSDTTLTSMTNLILALVLHPEVQKKAQAEIDAVVGKSRLPTFADEESLPYLQMVLAESLRWNPVTPISVPHALRQDDIYNGMFIPKGSVIMPNLWALMHDESMYPEPHTFWPERFDGRFPNARHPRSFAFGFNRRLCPGRHLALNSLFIQAANLLASFNVSKARDERGYEIEPIVDYSDGRPKPFKCKITPRSAEVVALIRSTVAASSA